MKKTFSFLLAMLMVATFGLSTTAWAVDVEDTTYYQKFKDAGISINVYNWGEYISDGSDDALDVNAAFEELTGITVNYSTFATNEELYAKLKSGGASYDVIIPSDYMITRMIQEGMLEKLNFDNIPAFKNISDEFKKNQFDPEGAYSVPYTWGTVGIVYNTTMVTDPVESWDILWNEKYKGNILMFANPRDAFGISLLRLGYSINTEDEAQLRQAAEELKKQKPLVQAYVMDEIFDKMQGNEAALAPYYAGDAYTMIADNENLAFAIPKEGTNVFVDAMCIPKGSQQKEAAEMYINFMCEAEVAAANIEYIGYSSPNAAAMELLDEEILNSPIIYPSADVLAKSEEFLHLSDETNKLLDALWTEIRTNDSNFLNWAMPLLLLVLIAAAFITISLRKRRKKRQQLY